MRYAGRRVHDEEVRIVTVSCYDDETLARADQVFLEAQGIVVVPIGYYYRKTGSVELRVPVDQREQALDLLRSIGRGDPHN